MTRMLEAAEEHDFAAARQMLEITKANCVRVEKSQFVDSCKAAFRHLYGVGPSHEINLRNTMTPYRDRVVNIIHGQRPIDALRRLER